MKTACKINPKMLSAYADGQLSEKDRTRVAQHLDVCDLCRREYKAIQSMERLLCGVEELAPSPDFVAGFWRKVGETEKIKARFKARWAWFVWRDWGFGPAWAAAAATVMIAFGVLLYRQSPSGSLDVSFDTPEFAISEDIELYYDLEIIQHLDLLEQWEAISSMEEI